MSQLSLFGKRKTKLSATPKAVRQEMFGLDAEVLEILCHKNKDALKQLLIKYQGSTVSKGNLFERVMAYLYHYNGYLVKLRKYMDVLTPLCMQKSNEKVSLQTN